ncbi:MAG TPA: type III secretion system gatekeeper subunit SctW, partial [Opitutales bacterium]|nr:type III secretion system gatekeeper subunit SctW [Opitutales bacterium]
MNQAAAQTDRNVAIQRTQNKLGLYLGQKAKHNPYAASVLQEIAEEAPAFASEKIGRDLASRESAKERAKQTKETKQQVEAKELAEFYLGLNSGNSTPPETLLKFLNRLRQMNDPNAQKVLAEAENEFADVTDQFIALSFVEEALHNEGNDPLSTLAGDAKKALMNASGPAVRAGLNATADIVAAAKGGLGQVADLRDFYRDVVLSHEGIIEVYQSIEHEYGAGRLPQALGFLIRAAGNDLSAQGPSIEPVHLRAIIDNLYQVEVLGGVHDSLATLLQRLIGNFNVSPEMDAEQLMAMMLSL